MHVTTGAAVNWPTIVHVCLIVVAALQATFLVWYIARAIALALTRSEKS